MSGTGDQKVPPQQQEYYPPPPPGPPPAHTNPLGSNPTYETHQQSVPQHPDEHPIPDYQPTAQQQQQQQQHYYYQPNAAELYGTDDPRPTAETKASSWSTRLAELGTKAAAPFNSLTTKLGTEAFLPAPMDKECEKAARILRAFCKDGVYHEPSSQQAAPLTTDYKPAPGTTTAPPPATAEQHKKKSHVLLKIPPKVIARAQGLAIFTTVRAGFHVSGSSGSGILLARLPDGSWSPPSGIQVHSVGAGFVVGLDIYDCVVVINTREALDAFTRTRMSLGTDLAVAAGQWGAGGALDFEFPADEEDRRRRQAAATTGTAPPNTATAPPLSAPETPSATRDRKPSPFRDAIKKPLYSYVRSRGFYAGVQIDGTVVTERRDANAAFYGDGGVTVDRILRGDVRPQPGLHQWPAAARGLTEVLVGIDEGARAAAAKSHGHHYGQPTRGVDAASAQQPHEQSAKAAEAAAEARANEPPSYQHHHEHETHHRPGDELPPAYADEHGVPRPGVGDVKGAGGQ